MQQAIKDWEKLMQTKPDHIVFWHKENGEFGVAAELTEESFLTR